MIDKDLNEINYTAITDAEKKILKSTIFKHVIFLKRKKQFFTYGIGIAASFLLFLSISYYKNDQSFSTDKFNTNQEITNSTDSKIQLILDNGEGIEIAEENAAIKYSNKGQQINIGESKVVNNQKSSNHEIVFNTLIVPYGKRSQIQLSDGSTVWLNSGTKLVYPTNFENDKREVYLEGEATFDVAHDKNRPFNVVADNHIIEVLGTVFNVSNYKNENVINTVLKSGSVQINYKGNSLLKPKEVLKITPGKLAVYNKESHRINTKEVDVEKYFSWNEGKLIFKNDNIEIIMKKLSRYYNLDIEIQNKEILTQTFSGVLDLKDNAEEVIQMIKETSNFEYKILNKHKIIIN